MAQAMTAHNFRHTFRLPLSPPPLRTANFLWTACALRFSSPGIADGKKRCCRWDRFPPPYAQICFVNSVINLDCWTNVLPCLLVVAIIVCSICSVLTYRQLLCRTRLFGVEQLKTTTLSLDAWWLKKPATDMKAKRQHKIFLVEASSPNLNIRIIKGRCKVAKVFCNHHRGNNKVCWCGRCSNPYTEV